MATLRGLSDAEVMTGFVDVTLTPNDFEALRRRNLARATCVVFDVLRFTSTVVTALANGADAIIPVTEIHEALATHSACPGALLGGERNGRRITSAFTGGPEFDLGNSPREYTPETVRGRTIVCTTTNGSRAINAVTHAQRVYIGSLLNLGAVARRIANDQPAELILVCSGTEAEAAIEDAYAAGALWDRICSSINPPHLSDSVQLVHLLFQQVGPDPMALCNFSRNAKRLLSIPELAGDVPTCLRWDVFDVVPCLDRAQTPARLRL